MAKKLTDLTLLGKPLTPHDNGSLSMTKKDFGAVLNDLGVTPEVQEVVESAKTKVIGAAINLFSEQLAPITEAHCERIHTAKQAVAAGGATAAQIRMSEADPDAPTIDINLGSGQGRMELGFQAKSEHKGRNPRTGEAVHSCSFGVVDVTVKQTLSTELDPQLKTLEKQCEETFGSKMKKD